MILSSFDFETTGLDTYQDQVVSFSVINYNTQTGERKVFARRCNPGILIPEQASQVHGITNEMVENEPHFSHYIKEFLAMIEGNTLCGQNIVRFDIPMLYYQARACGINWNPDMYNILDTFTVYSELFPRTLSAMHKIYTGEELEGAHDACQDSNAVISVVLGMMEKHQFKDFKEIINISCSKHDRIIDWERKLYQDSEGVLRFKFGKCKDLPVKEALENDPGYKQWIYTNIKGQALEIIKALVG